MKKNLIAMMALLAVVLTACNGPNSTYEELGFRANTSGFGHKYAQPENESAFVIAPGDTINIQVANNPQFSGSQNVMPEGTVTMPFVDPVHIAGLTPLQARDKLELVLSTYINDVTVQVVPLNLRSKKVYTVYKDQDGDLYVDTVQLDGDMTLIDLVAETTAKTKFADDCHVKLIRGDPLHPTVLTINLRDMLLNGFTGANVQMLPDDIVYFPPDVWGNLSIFVRRTTRPLRELSSSLRGISTAVNLIEDGELNGGYGGGYGGYNSGF